LRSARDGYHYTPLNDGQPWVARRKRATRLRKKKS